MRMYGSIQICFWEDNNIKQLSDQAKLLSIYLLTGPHSNMLGCYRLPIGYITEDLNWNNQAVKNSFQQLNKINFLTRDEENNWLVIHDFLRWNPIQNPKQGIGIQRLFDFVPSQSTVIKPLVNSLLIYGKYLNKEFIRYLSSIIDSCEMLSDDYVADKEQDQEQNQETMFMSGKPDIITLDAKHPEKEVSLKSKAMEVLDFLNSKVNRSYRPVDTNLKLIESRLKSGATVMDCRQIIAKKTREWNKDPKMSEYLRPATLFNAIKFEQYMGELVSDEEANDHGEE